MAQQSITSFFGVNKRKASATEDKSTPKERKIESGLEPQRSGPQKFESQKPTPLLNSYALGHAVSSEYQTNPSYRKRHQKFYEQIAGSKLASQSKTGRRAMKPYDIQFIDLKTENEDAMLMIQNGYKYQIMGEDAYIAGRFLGRSPVSGWRSLHDTGNPEDFLYDRFASITFPIERLPFYVEKLVVQGLKVAVAKQLETSALKAQGNNKRGPFQRKVTDVYTQGTMVEELSSSSMVSGHLLAINQTNNGFALIAIQLATGSGYYDVFTDDKSVAMELETRLLHIMPSEIIIVGSDLTGIAARMVDALDVRTVKLTANTDIKEEEEQSTVPKYISDVPELKECWDCLQQYLSEFQLSHALNLGLEPFTLVSFMYLGGDTLNSLEIYENQTTHEKRGSLFWTLDDTKTPFGRRLLRNWIGRPLLDRDMLAQRVEAMEEIMNHDEFKSLLFERLRQSLAKVPDLERYTLQTYHGRIAPKQLYWFLYHFKNLLTSITSPEITSAKIHNPLLQSILDSLDPMRQIVEPLLDQISPNAARGSYTNNYTSNGGSNGGVDLALYFKYKQVPDEDLNEDLQVLKRFDAEITKCRADFTEFVASQADSLGLPIKQVFPVGEENTFVIGVPKSKASKIPASWSRQGAISTEVRFWAPFSFEQTKKLKPLLEQQALASQRAYDNFVKNISETHFEAFRNCVSKIAVLDCLFSMAAISSRPEYVKPDLVDGRCLEIEDGRHPMLEQLLSADVIPNSVEMHASENRVMIITGANMGGKSSYVRQVALLVIMAQIGYYIPASKARLSLMDAVYTRMGAFDNLMRGESTFLVELKECAAIMAKATPNSLVIMDEIGRGTSTMDGVAIAEAVLHYVIEDIKSFTLFITHYPLLGETAIKYRVAENWSMDCAETESEVTFLYKVVRRQASRSYGINVARLAGLPESILKAAKLKSHEFEEEIDFRRRASRLLRALEQVIHGHDSPESLASLINNTGFDHSNQRICDSQE